MPFISYQMHNKTLLSWMLLFGIDVDGWLEPTNLRFFTLRIIIVDPFFIINYNLI